jgi:hypothetical protein
VRGSELSRIFTQGKGGERVSSDGERQRWERPTLTFEGNVEELVLAIAGKASVDPTDTQEPLKVIGL